MRTQPRQRVSFGKNGAVHAGCAQNKVLAIMEHTNFEKQAYLGTSSQKITEAARRHGKHVW
jgi:hypothetical protein